MSAYLQREVLRPTHRFALFLLSVGISLLGVAGMARAQTADAGDLHVKVVALYSFQPHTLESAPLNAKSSDLDEFWKYAKANAKTVLPQLRKELTDASNPSFFFYDGAKLLLSLSSAKADRELALVSLAKVDLQDVQATDYLKTVQWFARNGFDTREAAFRILAYPEFKAFIPQHALTLGQDYSLIYMLFPLQNIPFEENLIARLKTEQDVRSQKSLLLALWYTVTPTATAAIKEFSERPGLDESMVAYARRFMTQGLGNVISTSSAQSLHDERAKTMQRPISDEALSEFDVLTMKLLAKQ